MSSANSRHPGESTPNTGARAGPRRPAQARADSWANFPQGSREPRSGAQGVPQGVLQGFPELFRSPPGGLALLGPSWSPPRALLGLSRGSSGALRGPGPPRASSESSWAPPGLSRGSPGGRWRHVALYMYKHLIVSSWLWLVVAVCFVFFLCFCMPCIFCFSCVLDCFAFLEEPTQEERSVCSVSEPRITRTGASVQEDTSCSGILRNSLASTKFDDILNSSLTYDEDL